MTFWRRKTVQEKVKQREKRDLLKIGRDETKTIQNAMKTKGLEAFAKGEVLMSVVNKGLGKNRLTIDELRESLIGRGIAKNELVANAQINALMKFRVPYGRARIKLKPVAKNREGVVEYSFEVTHLEDM